MRLPALALLALTLVAPLAVAELREFTATYEVRLDGKPQGRSTITLVQEAPGVWRHGIEAEGTRGLARMSGFGMRQTSRFRMVDGRPQLQTADARREVLVRSRSVRTVFDWEAGVARWEGDLKPDQRGPVVLSADAANAALLNLLLALDSAEADPGSSLRYRLLERGKADRVDYVIGTSEQIEVPAGRYLATPVQSEHPSRRRQTTIWYAPGLPPTPVRVLQVETDKPSYELRLAAISSAAP